MAAATSSAPRGTAGELFCTTRWTVVMAAGRQPSPQADAALDALCRTYWYPLYAYVRRRGCSREDAEDLTQGFFAKLLARNDLAGLSNEKGKFRAFLLAAIKHFLANEWDRARARKRGGGVATLSLDWQDAETRYCVEPVDDLTPDKLFDRAWGVTLLERVILRLRDEQAAAGHARLFASLRPFLAFGTGAIPYAEAAAQLGLTEGAVRVATHRLRRRYRELLRHEISQTLADPSGLDDELRALFAAFGG